MADRIAALEAVFTANTSPFEMGLNRVSRSMTRTGNYIQGQMGDMGRGIQSVGRLMTGAALAGGAAMTAAIGGAVAAGINEFSTLQSGMNEVFTLMPGITESAMSNMTDDVRRFSNQFSVVPEELVPALYQALSAGVPPDNVFEFLEQANQAAVGGITSLETSVDGISSVVNAYGSDILSAGEASNLMFTAVRLGKTTFDEMARSLSNVTPQASSLGLGFENVTAAIATLTSSGVPTAEATTQIRQALIELGDSTSDVGEAFQTVAGESFRDFIAGGGDMSEALTLLQSYASETGVPIDQLFSSVEAGAAALGLTGANAEAFADTLEEMGNSAGATEAAYEQMDEGINRSAQGLRAAFSVAAGALGELFAPAVSTVLDTGADFLRYLGAVIVTGDDFNDWLTHIPGPLQSIARAMGRGINAIRGFADQIGAVIWRLESGWSAAASFADVFGDIIPPRVFFMIEGVAEGIADVVESFIQGEDVLIAFGIAIGAFVLPILAGIAAAIAPVIFGFGALVAGVALVRRAWEDNFLGVQEIVGGVFESIADFVGGVVDLFGEVVGVFQSEGLSAALDAFAAGFGGLLDGLFANLGNVAGTIYDNIIAPIAGALSGYVGSGQLWADAQALGASVMGGIQSGVQTALSLLGGAASWLSTNVIQPIASGISTYVGSGALWDNLRVLGITLLGGLQSGLSTAFQFLGGAASWVYTNIIQPVANAVSTYVGSGQLWNDLSALGSNLLSALQTGLRLQMQFLGGAAGWVFANVIQPIATAVSAYVGSGQLWNDLTALGQSVVDGIGEGVTAAFTAIGGAATWINTNIITPISDAFSGGGEGGNPLETAAQTLGGGVVDGIAAGVTAAFQAIGGVATWIDTNIVQPFVTGFAAGAGAEEGGIGAAARTLGASILDGIAAGVGTTADMLLFVWNDIIVPMKDQFLVYVGSGALWDNLVSLGASILDGIAAGIGSIILWVSTDIIQPIAAAIPTAPTLLVSALGTIGGSILTWIGDAIPAIGTWVDTNIVQPFVTALSGLGATIMGAINAAVPNSVDIQIPRVHIAGHTVIEAHSVGFSLPDPFPGYASGTTWTGSGPANMPAGFVHHREAVVPAGGMSVIPSPSGLMLQGNMPSGNGRGGDTVIQTLNLYAEDIEDLYDQLQRVAQYRAPISGRGF